MNKKTHLGKVRDEYLGYKIRIMLKSQSVKVRTKSGREESRTKYVDNGTLGVYAGKKLIKSDFKTIDSAKVYIDEFIKNKKVQ